MTKIVTETPNGLEPPVSSTDWGSAGACRDSALGGWACSEWRIGPFGWKRILPYFQVGEQEPGRGRPMMQDGRVRRLKAVIEDSEWQWRTVHGLSVDTQIPEDEVKQLLESNPDIFLRSPVGHRETGEPIYTTREHYTKKRGFFDRLSDVSSSTST